MTSSKETRTHWCVNCWCVCVFVCEQPWTLYRTEKNRWGLEFGAGLFCAVSTSPWESRKNTQADTYTHVHTLVYSTWYTDTHCDLQLPGTEEEGSPWELPGPLYKHTHTHTCRIWIFAALLHCTPVCLWVCLLIQFFNTKTYYIDFSISLHHVCFKSCIMYHTSSMLYRVYLQPISNTDTVIGWIISGQNCVNKI